MSLYFIFTVDGDWDEYFSTSLSKRDRRPHRPGLIYLIKREIELSRIIGGKILHFVHTSPVARKYFLAPEFIDIWKRIEAGGGSVGVHCHEEGLFDHGRLTSIAMLEESVHSLTEPLRENGITLISYRGGYLTFCKSVIPVLERNGLFLDFSCDPGRFLHHKGRLISNWRGSPKNYYRMCYQDHREKGKSDVIEIPLGKSKKRALYIDITSLADIALVARRLARKERITNENIIVSVLTHTYEFSSFWKRLRIAAALSICKLYGSFINDKEALKIIEGKE